MKFNFLYIFVVLLVVSCKPHFYSTNSVINELKSFDLEKFDRYTFQLVKKDTTSIHPIFTNGKNRTDKDLVYEELYLFLEQNGNRALYLTTFSHKYIYDGGVFNNNFSNKKISANEIDFIFVGSYDKDKIIFDNPKNEDIDKVEFYYSNTNDVIKLEKITNNYGFRKDRKSNPLVDMDSVFAIDIVYQKDSREFVYVEKDKTEVKVESLSIDSDNLYFGLAENKIGKFRFLKDRIANDFTE